MYFHIRVDGENNSDWWDLGGLKVWREIEEKGRSDENGGYFLDKEDGLRVLQRAVLIDGWEGGGPAYAPRPLIISVNNE